MFYTLKYEVSMVAEPVDDIGACRATYGSYMNTLCMYVVKLH